jgi:Lon protease-like protein
MATLPMFPLGHVLLPSVYLPLHIFEVRYRELVEVCIAGDQEFGVVLIERGQEVGGGDTRTRVGTVARIVEAAQLDDGRWAIGAIGTRRIRVSNWLPDDPYPMAEVDDWLEADPPADLADRLVGVTRTLRRVLALRTELGDFASSATVELADDPVLASYQIVAVAPLGPADQQALLEVATASERVERLAMLLADEETYLGQRLALETYGDEPPPAG